MKTHKVRFGQDDIKPECKKELFKNRRDIPICVVRKGPTVHQDFRPIKRQVGFPLSFPVVPEPPPPTPVPVPPKPIAPFRHP